MNTFKRKALFTAVLAGLGVAGTAEAVYLNPNGTGQVLVYPYYTVQSATGSAYHTYISVVNTTTRAKAVKVRVLEGKTSAEVLDFNLFLSPNDMWTAAVIPGPGAGDAARMVTSDRSCTSPVGNLPVANGGEEFRNVIYANNASDALPGTGLDRTREGYIEIIEMGTLTGTWAAAVTHTAAGVPANCATVQGPSLTPSSIEAPSGGLMGTGTLINVANGQDFGYKADALEAWRSTDRWTDAGSEFPKLDEATPAVSVVLKTSNDPVTGASTGITAYRNTFVGVSGVTAGARAVASVFMHSAVLNEWILDAGSLSGTDWVVTQPMKRFFVTNVTAAQPYSNVMTTSGACETVEFSFRDREEAGATAAGSDFSPIIPGPGPNAICWESTVLSIRNNALPHTRPSDTTPSTVLASRNVTNVKVRDLNTFQNGFARLSFIGVGAATRGMGSSTSERVDLSGAGPAGTTGVGPVTFFGLPVTGFMVRTFRNNDVPCGTATCQASYGSLFNHSYTTTITP